MGNCQAVDAAALVIQHPSGKIERFYWPILASDVMKMNPGHYVSLIIPLPSVSTAKAADDGKDKKPVQFTRVKLLRPTDTLSLGHAYRLVTTQEVVKVLRAKKSAKMKRQQPESTVEKPPEKVVASDSGTPNKPANKDKQREDHQAVTHERQRPRASNSIVMRSKSWRPALQSIAESGS